MTKFINTNKEISSNELNSLESKYEFELTKEYRDHIMINNGGYPEFQYFEGKGVSYFYSIHFGKSTLIDDAIDAHLDILPEKYMPFAYDMGGNQFCINLNKGNEYGYIYFVPDDMGEIEPEFLAKTLTEFLKELSEDEDW